MYVNTNPFEWLGQAFGTLVRLIVDGLAWVFDMLSGASTAFVNGFSRALGIDSSILSIAFVVLGLFLIYLGVSSFIKKRIIAGVIWLLLGLWLLSTLIR
ncbi:hypothetical protein DHB74_06130 [Pseudomonas sp. G11-1]|uniref:Uncharacterized protein n=1 Tax=Halopseudomonas bauzanensis TaxID=653930 RepID=A0A1H9WUG9_9GAMM|nr:hypothetical protein [Halopseudomonas bauzanensis]MCO5785931.1 hypothetical protein [Pseudomonas sp. G11-1]MCO5787965.1 hypothetical protein [Pseudomonas sp. G11-2]TKA93017.1 hypothetical protein FA869_02190 [Halopseudomonas bauzanensis]SES37590.1 hypothetical protein SAMN05216589_0090 [Halopseudomonas bauzanensis]SFM40266.1 hypothetical protein SAMN04487855_0090 [Halopseudomonas bauzanensis]